MESVGTGCALADPFQVPTQPESQQTVTLSIEERHCVADDAREFGIFENALAMSTIQRPLCLARDIEGAVAFKVKPR